MNLIHQLVSVENIDIESALRTISDSDVDFNGENGIDYVWPEAKEKGYESNQDYLLDRIKKIDGEIQKIGYFFDKWMLHDTYYVDYSWEYITDENDNIIAISLAAITEA